MLYIWNWMTEIPRRILGKEWESRQRTWRSVLGKKFRQKFRDGRGRAALPGRVEIELKVMQGLSQQVNLDESG